MLNLPPFLSPLTPVRYPSALPLATPIHPQLPSASTKSSESLPLPLHLGLAYIIHLAYAEGRVSLSNYLMARKRDVIYLKYA